MLQNESTINHPLVGRTARAGRAGISVSLAGEQERKMVKDIIKRAKYPVKNRIIPSDIIQKYQEKIAKLQPQIEQILHEEEEERLLSKAENQANKMKKILSGENDPVRPWFQTKQQRKKEKEKLKNLNDSKKNKKAIKAKQKKTSNENEDKLSKIAAAQARSLKRNNKQKKIRTVADGNHATIAGGNSRKRKSHFEDLVKTKNAKQLRHKSKFEQKQRFKKRK